MKNIYYRTKLSAVLLVCTTCANAQWLNHPDPRTPRTPDGKPNLSAPAPRASNGKPDLSGVWQAHAAQAGEALRLLEAAPGPRTVNQIDPGVDLQTYSKYFLNVLADFKPGEEPMRPEAAALLKQRGQSQGKDIPTSHCLPGGVPFSTLIAPFKIIQTPLEIVMLLEDTNPPRQIYTDGRKLPANPEPMWMGYSVGKWEGDTLVADSVGFNDRTWLDAFGHPHTESMHIVERFRRINFGHMDIEVTIDDPKMYTRPFTVKFPARLLPDTDTLESVCAENERDRPHLDR
jgi:hypothetical protein